jgi:hypothetical protein
MAQQNKEKPPTSKKIPKTTPENRDKGKDKMPPMTRATPDPLKQMRQQQAAEAKLLAAQNRQREGLRKEQEKTRAAEAAEKQTNQDRLAKQNNPENTTKKDTLPDPTQIPETDPEILPDITADKVTTPEGDVAEASMDYTLSEEGEGDNISGNKELRGEAQHEDENISKRLK